MSELSNGTKKHKSKSNETIPLRTNGKLLMHKNFFNMVTYKVKIIFNRHIPTQKNGEFSMTKTFVT
jgi:hypothetical protein